MDLRVEAEAVNLSRNLTPNNLPINNEYQLKNDFPLVFIMIIIALVFGWVLTNLWTRVIENIAYVSCGLDINSTWHTFIVACVVTLILVNYISYLQSHNINVQNNISAPLGAVSFPSMIGNISDAPGE
jgi:hypothetical protein